MCQIWFSGVRGGVLLDGELEFFFYIGWFEGFMFFMCMQKVLYEFFLFWQIGLVIIYLGVKLVVAGGRVFCRDFEGELVFGVSIEVQGSLVDFIVIGVVGGVRMGLGWGCFMCMYLCGVWGFAERILGVGQGRC